MKPAPAKARVRIAVFESDPLRLIGFRSLFDGHKDFDIVSCSMSDIKTRADIDIVLLGSNIGHNLFDNIATMKALRPDLKIIVTGTNADDETILKVVTAGAKGYVEESCNAEDFTQALRIVEQGSIWAPRRVLSLFVDRATSSPGRPLGKLAFTDREREVLELLVAGRSNKEIGSALGIEERTVKAHVAKLMRKVGAPNRIALSVHAITHSLVEQP